MNEEEEKKEVGEPKRHSRIHIEVNDIGEKGKKSMWARTWIALVMILILLPAAILGGWVFAAAILVAAVMATYEIYKAPQKKFPWWIFAITLVNVITLIYWPIIYVNVVGALQNEDWVFTLEGSFSYYGIVIQVVHVGIMMLIYFWLGVGSKDFDFGDVAHFITMILLVGLGLQSCLVLRFYPFYHMLDASGNIAPFQAFWQSLELLLFAVLGACINDTFAYFVGVLFGKHHMNEKISPKKTWEGFFGGWFFGAAFAIGFGLIVSVCGAPMLPGLFDADHWYWIVVAGILLPLVGDLGDLSFSLIKRHYGFKDYSHLLGPHGGLLDRLDSLIFCFLTLAMVVSMATTAENLIVF